VYHPATLVLLDDQDMVQIPEESYLREDQFIFHTPIHSRQSIFGKHLRPSALPIDLLAVPPLGEPVIGALIPKLVANPKLARKQRV
jgi:hypothetical protein